MQQHLDGSLSVPTGEIARNKGMADEVLCTIKAVSKIYFYLHIFDVQLIRQCK